MCHVNKCVRIELEKLKGGDYSGELGVDGNLMLKQLLGKYGGNVWIRFIWLSIGAGCELM
jgi:hypothetical protein